MVSLEAQFCWRKVLDSVQLLKQQTHLVLHDPKVEGIVGYVLEIKLGDRVGDEEQPQRIGGRKSIERILSGRPICHKRLHHMSVQFVEADVLPARLEVVRVEVEQVFEHEVERAAVVL